MLTTVRNIWGLIQTFKRINKRKSGIIEGNNVDAILTDPSEYIESEKYFSWEQYFTALLTSLANQQEPYKHYSKRALAPFYLQQSNVQKILAAMEDGQ